MTWTKQSLTQTGWHAPDRSRCRSRSRSSGPGHPRRAPGACCSFSATSSCGNTRRATATGASTARRPEAGPREYDPKPALLGRRRVLCRLGVVRGCGWRRPSCVRCSAPGAPVLRRWPGPARPRASSCPPDAPVRSDVACAFARRFSILSRTWSNVGTSSPTVAAELVHRLVHLLLHLRLVELAQELLARPTSCSAEEFCVRRLCLAFSEACGASSGPFLRSSICFSRLMTLSANASAAVVEARRLVGVAGLRLLVGQHQRLLRRRVGLRVVVHRAVEVHLELLLVGDDVRRLLRELAMLVARLGDRLLELDLRVGRLLELQPELRAEVPPPLLDRLEHGAGSYSVGWMV